MIALLVAFFVGALSGTAATMVVAMLMVADRADSEKDKE